MNIYELLQKTITIKKHLFSTSQFSNENQEKLESDDDKALYELLKNICSICMKAEDNNVEYIPAMIFDNKRTYSTEDITERDYQLLSSLDFEKLPINIRARVADILWIQKKDYKSAITAVESYYDLFNMLFSDQDWLEALDMIRRAICISAQINNNSLHSTYCKTIFDHLIRINGTDNEFLSINLINILLVQSFGEYEKIIDVLDNMIAINQNNPYKIEQAYILKTQCAGKLKDEALATQTNIDQAEYFLSYGEKIFKDEKIGALRSELYFEKAIQLFRNNGEPHRAELAHKRLIEIQKEKIKALAVIEKSFDASNVCNNISKNMENLSFEECIIRLTQFTPFYNKDTIKKELLDRVQSSPLEFFCTKSFMNEDGQTVLNLPPITLHDHIDEDALELHTHHQLFDCQSDIGNFYLRFVLSYIREFFDVDTENLTFLTSQNAIIPDGRAAIIEKAIRLALKGNFYESLHILAPQTENIFRNIAKEVGGLTVTLESDGTSKEKVLSSIFDLPELLDCYDNDILFLFQSMLNEQAGANIRNVIAHGIMNETSSSSGANLYFICAVIKLLVMYSSKCYEIKKDNQKLKSFTPLSKET